MIPWWLPALFFQQGAQAPPAPPAAGEATADAETWKAGPFDLTGVLDVGWRWLDVDGSRSQFDEDLNLDRGLVLRELSLEGRRPAGGSGLQAFSLHALGVGEPDTSYAARAELDDLILDARYDRSEYSANAEEDFHTFDSTRERASLVVERPPGADGRSSGFDLSWQRREGVQVGTRSVDFGFVSGFPSDSKEELFGASNRLALEAGGFDVDVVLGVEQLEEESHSAFALPSPTDPGSTQTEDSDASGGGLGGHALVDARRSFDDVTAEFGLDWRAARIQEDLELFETGILFDPSITFERTTKADSDLAEHEASAHAALTYDFDSSASLELRYTHEEESRDGDLIEDVVLSELGVPSEAVFPQHTSHDSRLDLVEVGVSAEPTELTQLDLSLQAGLEDLKILQTSEGLAIRTFDDTVPELGGQTTLTFDPSARWRLQVDLGWGMRTTENAESVLQFDMSDEREQFGCLSASWRPAPGSSISAKARRDDRESDAFDSESAAQAFTLAGAYARSDRLALDASFTYRTLDLRSDTTFTILSGTGFPELVSGETTFQEIERIAVAGLSYGITDALRPRVSCSAAAMSGDSSIQYGALQLTVPLRLGAGIEVGTDLDFVHFDAEGTLDASDYDASMLVAYVRKEF